MLRAANFTEVEIGLQSIDPTTQDLMDRRNNLKAFERGVSALMDAGIRVKIECVEQLLATCYEYPNYLDRYYSLNPQGLLGSKRVLVVVNDEVMDKIDPDWADTIEETATLVARG